MRLALREDLRRGARAEARDRRRRLRDLRRALHGHPEVHNGAEAVVPVDLYIPGCPPHPLTILDGLLRLLGRIDDSRWSPRRQDTTE